MIVMVYVTALALLLVLTSMLVLRVDAARLANGLRAAGPVVLGIAGLILLFTGRAGLGGMLLSGALAWYASARRMQQYRRSPGTRSSVRTAALEMELDHDSGMLQGMVLAGRFEGRMLVDLDSKDLMALLEELSTDAESRQLLETYLDGRIPGWRDDVQAHGDRSEGVAPRSGPMTEQEAYQILGLEPGASVAEIRKAHRRLMQRLHPDLGGSSFLAARINEAKDVLLSDHR